MRASLSSFLAVGLFALTFAGPATAVDDKLFETVIRASVRGERVDYDAAEKNRKSLKAYLEGVAKADFSRKKTSADSMLAFYVNAYNALVLEAVLEHKRPKSVLDVPGFFDKIKYTVAGEQLTLNELEEKKIRSSGDPRVHFVVNCASVGCPPLAGGLYTAGNMQGALTKKTHEYLHRDGEVVINDETKTIEVTQLFNWYQKDFGGEKGAREFLAKHLEKDKARILDPSYKLTYREYDWRLNALK